MPMIRNLFCMVVGATLAGSVAAQQAPEVRRVVTKIDASGKAVVMIDGQVKLATMRSPNPASEMWVTQVSPPDFSWIDDRAKTKVGLVPPKGGTVFRIVEFVPTDKKIESMD